MCKKLIYLTCFGFVLGLTLTNAANAQDPNLLGWWKLDESSGNIAYDSSGNFNDGVLTQVGGFLIADPQWVYGYAGGALWLDGVDDFIEVPHDESQRPGEEVTVMAWINTPRYRGAGNSGWQAILTKGLQFRLYNLYLIDESSGLHFSIGPEGSFVGSASIATVPLNEWVHVCAQVIDGGHLYYINGEPSEPIDGAGEGTVIPRLGEETIRIGNAPENNSFLGKIDDARVYNGALSQEEIQLIMISGLSSAATLPSPDNGAQEVPRTTLLSWKEGQYSDTRNVYFGTDFNDVNEASESEPRGVLAAERQNDTTFDPLGTDLLEFNKTYYWRVDEINDLDPNSPWKGAVWSFTTANFLTVDDFEDYNDYEPHRIFDTWKDGFGTITNGATVGYPDPDFDAGEHFVETSITHNGKQSMPFFYDNDSKYSEAERRWTDAQDWTRENVDSLTIWFRGHPAKVSSFAEEPTGIFTVKGIGGDIWDRFDEFHFAYKELSGSVKMIAKVDSIENTDPYAKAGIMIRDTLDANARYCALLMTPENGVRYQYRTSVNNITDREFDPNVAVPSWVRLERTSGGLVRAYYSADGDTWTPFTLKAITMSMPIYIGLAVTSHDPIVPCEAKFSNVDFPDTTVDPEWTAQDIGVPTNEVEPMYVVLNGSAVVYHDDPNASLIDEWTRWEIPLQRFADLGINLSSVNSFGIGFGNRNNPQAGGQGKMYIDDIRLYLPAVTE